ncbi:lysylphosphatidylglycerol synthase domain-containing protein [Planktothrix paucivesiculata]|uniref:Uncharacterized protein n=1 Tax=Planktothrix paucivesiculata PCC 9631 TaxID=671071 RepID=A0A7Z9E5L1_9CYAN|nr:lysylphosphatidylglycerol synthase domain-containing protein [Planktothrix paucivesiculata]VXD25808.1 conserved membrane hypothetical protein [Planktothrix paucivesiculata PCC 9631]
MPTSSWLNSEMNRMRKILPSFLGFLLFCLSIWAISQKLEKYSIDDVLISLSNIPKINRLGAISLMTISYLMTTAYDILAFIYIGFPLNYFKIAIGAFISYAISNNVGFSFLTGSAVRYRLYSRWRVPPGVIAQVIAFTNLTFWLGLLGVCGLVFLLTPLKIPSILDLPFVSVRPVGIIFLIAVAVYLLWAGFNHKPVKLGELELNFPTVSLSLALIAFATFDWGAAGGVLYVLLPEGSTSSYLSCFSIYLLAMIASMISSIPGGLGVFETVVLTLVSSEVNPAKVLGSLLAYRAIYYLLPMIVATLLLAITELKKQQ